jgi:glycogen operon protein
VAFTLAGQAAGEPMLHIVFNMHDEPRDVALPVLDNRSWRRMVDTSAESPRDIVPDVETAAIERGACRAGARSVVVLESD